MRADRILDALNNVNEDYIIESAPGKKKRKHSHIRWIAAVIALVMILTFLRTSPGIAALEIVKETVTNFIETLFPPKDITVTVEGDKETVQHIPGGQAPEVQTGVPGFAIYYDPNWYTMSKENGNTYIRFIAENNLPPCELEIEHVPGVLPSKAAENTKKEMEENGNQISEVEELENGKGYVFHFSTGTEWNSACGDVFFLSDMQDGCFKITARYFKEAAEGHGVRFAQMVQTFEVVKTTDLH
jgi:hypothetical protein